MTLRILAAACAVALVGAGAAYGQPSLRVGAFANVDVVSNVAGGGGRRAVELDKEQVDIDLDLDGVADRDDRMIAHLSVMNVSGGMPNLTAGTLQGINNIEAASHRLRLYEAWIEQPFAEGRLSVRAGLYDLNSEFYATESAATLLNPGFGIGSELAATGSAGPAIFPSTALAGRLNVRPTLNSYVRVAVVNAAAGTLGDRGGVNTRFDEGVLTIAELGYAGDSHFAVGVWRYSRGQDHLLELDDVGDPRRRAGQGLYLMAERRLLGEPDGARMVTGFVRAGVSDGRTSPFRGSAQAGVLVERVFAGREDSLLSLGVNVGVLGGAYRDVLRAGGTPAAAAETQLEITYADNLLPNLQVQPDLQYTFNPGGVSGADGVLTAAIRFTVTYGAQ